MKKFKLDNEEKQFLKEFKAGEWKRIENFEEEKKRIIKIAKYTQKLLKLGKHPSQLNP